MSVHPALRVEIKDEGTIQGRARSLNFIGGLIAAAMSGDVANVTLSLTANDTSTIDLTLSGSTLTADIVSASITNTYINASAAIAVSKLAALTATKAVITDSSGFLSTSAVTPTELLLLSGVTALATGFTLLGTYTPSNVASVDVTSKISSTYEFYVGFFDFAPATDGADAWVRTDTSNGASFDAGSTDYDHIELNAAAGAVNETGSTGDTKGIYGVPVGNASGEGISGIVVLTRGSSTSFPRMVFVICAERTDGTNRVNVTSVKRKSAATINAVQFLFSTGNIASGFLRFYGAT